MIFARQPSSAIAFRAAPEAPFARSRSVTRSPANENHRCCTFGHNIMDRALSSVPMPSQTPLVFKNLHGRCRTLSAAKHLFSMAYFTTPVTHRDFPSKSEGLAKPVRGFEPCRIRKVSYRDPSFRAKREPLAVRAFLAWKIPLGTPAVASNQPRKRLLRYPAAAPTLADPSPLYYADVKIIPMRTGHVV
jgi:hypothetical protein